MGELVEFIRINLFNKEGRFEGQRINMRWFELRNFSHNTKNMNIYW